MAALSIADKRLGAFLLERGYINDESLQQAIGRQVEAGGPLSRILVESGFLSERRIARAIEETTGIRLVTLRGREIARQVLSQVTPALALKTRAIPFEVQGERISVAFEDPLDPLAIETIEDATGRVVDPHLALSEDIDWALASFYPELNLRPPQESSPDPAGRLGRLAVAERMLTLPQLKQASQLSAQQQMPLRQVLLQQGLLSEDQVARLEAKAHSLRYVGNLAEFPVTEGLANRLLRLDAVKYQAAPLQYADGKLAVAIASGGSLPELEELVRKPVEFVIGRESEVMKRIESLYEPTKGRLGETLVRDRKLDRDQLRQALDRQDKLGRIKPLGEILIELGYVKREDVEEALRRQRSGEGRLEETLLASGKLSPEMLARSLATQLGYEYIDEDEVSIDPYAVSLVPESTVRRYNAMPVRLEGNALVVALKDPRHIFALDDIQLITGREIRPAVATEDALGRLINRFYRNGEDMNELAKAVLEEVGQADDEVAYDSAIDDNALVRIVNSIIREAVINDISDIHIEPRPDRVIVRVRKDGTLREYMTMPKATAAALAARVKIMGGLNIAERRMPQDGRVRFKDRSIEVDLRLSTLPTVYGEKAVMRLLKKASSIPEIEQLGFAPHNFKRFEDIIQKPYGMFLITGPTGSGKSFTTFSVLKRIAVPEVNVSTVEDPVEYEIPGINQTQVNPKAGLTFANALRSFLRQDPDIIMVGEIRDQETAKISVEAALTGHLLIATLHTNDSAGAITRLVEMGIEPFNVSASLVGVLAQRLVRRVCEHCRTEYTPEPDVLRRLGLSDAQIQGRKLYRGIGCERCGGSGYNGRYAIHELLYIDDDLEAAIVQDKSSFELRDLAMKNGMKTLRQDGILKAFKGITTLEEVLTRTAE